MIASISMNGTLLDGSTLTRVYDRDGQLEMTIRYLFTLFIYILSLLFLRTQGGKPIQHISS